MRGRRKATRPRPEAVAASREQHRPTLAWGLPEELRANKRGELHPAQRARILGISIFEPWLRLLFGAFFIVFGLTQRFDSWQSWLPIALGALPLISAINGLLARRRLRAAIVEVVEGQVDEVRPAKAEAVAGRLSRDGRMMFLLNHEGAGELPRPDTNYRFYAVFGVIRPPIVLAMETLD